ncbi:Modification methylase SalI [Candidatus Terasakiella magnetica]|nr:Modification methylase SalI [Candidatus Terasakiella magnetica]
MRASNESIETQRLNLQEALDSKKSQQERNKLGQFATPTALAREILSFSLDLLPKNAPVHFLDPAIGTGSFYSALIAAAKPDRIASARGFEIDGHYGRPASDLWANTPLCITLGDFTTAQPDEARANLVICNPPYVRHHHLAREEKVRLQNASEEACGVPITGLAGLYTYFLALSHAWMADDGIAAWLIPSEWMDVNYGRAVKKYLLEKVTLLRIHRFDPIDTQFGDALVSSSIVFFSKNRPKMGRGVEFTFGGSLSTPRVQRNISLFDLKKEAKWSRYPVSEVRDVNAGPKLKDFFKIRRGLATGDNNFFIMTREQIRARNLPDIFFRPILPSPRYLQETEIHADTHGNPAIKRQLFLLDCRLSEAEVKAKHPTLWAYFQYGIPDVSERYLCSHRTPWYSQEDRPASPFLCTYMGRDTGKNGGTPFRFILNHSAATAANVYLFLYPKPILKRAIEQDGGLARRVWNVLQSIQTSDLTDEGRVYGGGLHKMEPKELANVGAEAIAALLPEYTHHIQQNAAE